MPWWEDEYEWTDDQGSGNTSPGDGGDGMDTENLPWVPRDEDELPPDQLPPSDPIPPPSYPGGGGGGRGNAYDPGEFSYTPPPYGGSARPVYNFKPAPTFDAPEFTAPSATDALNSPGYQFRLDQGRGALEASAAARGVTRTGGNLKGILQFGQNFASQEYANVFNRALQTFATKYKGAQDEFAPEFSSWQTLTAAEQRAGDLAFAREWDQYTFGINDQFRREEMIFNAGVD